MGTARNKRFHKADQRKKEAIKVCMYPELAGPLGGL